jgi:hypothetical protein
MKDTGVRPKIEKGIYQHYKGGIYEVLELACHTETLEWYVVYKSLKRATDEVPSVWVRPYSMFADGVNIEGKTVPRFQILED